MSNLDPDGIVEWFADNGLIVGSVTRKKLHQIFVGDALQQAGVDTDDRLRQLAFALVEIEGLLFDGVAGDQGLGEERRCHTNERSSEIAVPPVMSVSCIRPMAVIGGGSRCQ